MGRNRVLSFMSSFSGGQRDSKTPTPSSSPPYDYTQYKPHAADTEPFPAHSFVHHPATPPSASPGPHEQEHGPSPVIANDSSPLTSPARQRSTSRPLSMVHAYQPPLMDVNEDTIPELQPIFTFLNSHANKLYQEGYFLKLDDQNTQGRPNPDRTWTECFAQLVGTVLSLWDAAELDAAGEDGEVLPKFINLTDASIKMIESLPTRSNDEQPLQNILSISTAGRNRYLLHFNSHHSLIQWTAGIRLSMYEHSTLQEAYTGALIAGKAKTLNNINVIMDRTRVRVEQWVRVRFGAGVPWRRCWCVISPPDEKEYQKLQKELKKRSPYDRSHAPVLKGDIKFYDTKKDGKKQKKTRPIASISDAYSAYAIYPQAKSLIDASTLIKVEGNITIHSEPPSSTEGFVFIMPETHPMVSGFEMLLRFLFPTWDTFNLYGRPGRLVASTLDSRSLMFAMPKHRRYGYMEILDVSGLILTDGSSSWSDREWRKQLKDLTGKRMNAVEDSSRAHSRANSRRSNRLSFGPVPAGASGAKAKVGFADDAGSRASRSLSMTGAPPPRTDSAPPSTDRAASALAASHARNTSDPPMFGQGPPPRQDTHPYDGGYGPPQQRGQSPQRGPAPVMGMVRDERPSFVDRISSEDEHTARSTPVRELEGGMRNLQTPEPVSAPPSFNHKPQSRPGQKAYHSPELRRANSRLSSTTLAQMAKAGGMSIPTDMPPSGSSDRRSAEDAAQSGLVHPYANPVVAPANPNGSREVLNPGPPRLSPGIPPPDLNLGPKRSKSPLAQEPYSPPPSLQTSALGPGARDPTPEMRPPPYNQTTQAMNRQPPPAQAQMNQTNYYQPPPSGPLPGPPVMKPQEAVMGGKGHGPDPRSWPPGNQPPTGYGPQGPRSPGFGPPGYGPPGQPGNQYGGYGPGPQSGPPNAAAQREALPALNTSGAPIHRKPLPQVLPQRTTSLQKRDDDTPVSTSSTGSFGNNVIDQAAFDQVRPRAANPRFATAPEQRIIRQDSERSERSGASSHYDDASSTASPDYASTRKSTDTAHSADRPRAGVLKTVGGEPPMPTKPAASDFTIPDINFGPTINYASTPIPRNKTPTPTNQMGQRSYSPARSPAKKSPVPDLGHGRHDSDDTIRRMVAWQPGGTSPGSAAGGNQGVSAEQFVQQRAAAAAAPMYAHGRTPSGNTLATMRSMTPSPGMSRTASQDMLQRHSRSNSADLLQRPNSRGAASSLGISGTGDMSSHLSAREQEHVARATGSPLISMAGNRGQNAPGGGLVGAIQAREREREQIKQGVNNQAVQYAINQRQAQAQAQVQAQALVYQQQLSQQQANMYMQQNMSQQMMYPMGNQGNMNMGGMVPQYGQGMVQHSPGQSPYGPPQGGNFAGPGASVYAQGGGFTSPGPTFQQRQAARPQSPQMVDPRFISPVSPIVQGGRGQPQPGYQSPPTPHQGHAF